MSSIINSDYLVIGSGIAGLSFALKVADHGSVNIISKRVAGEANTSYAQGGIASVTTDTDSIQKHIDDTLIAGAGLCHHDAVESALSNAPERIRDLVEWGVNFTRTDNGSFDLAREGGHSEYRVLHAADMTGAEIERALLEKARQHRNINIYENHLAIDIITEHQVLGNLQSAFNICFGAYVLSEKDNVVVPFQASYTVIATGGASRVFLHSTNPEIATGDGVAMAYRAGVRIANMEFVQFHPTSLYNPGKRSFLISEALRGFGGLLINGDHERFMPKYDARAELAPRDIVARGIDAEMKKRREDCVFLDMRHLDSAEVTSRFPNIYQHCKDALQIDISKDLIPVVPAAHYFCGGIMTSLNGQTSMQNLYALGEAAHTGLHGANRLASNSLMEGLAFSHNAAMKVINKRPRNFGSVIIPDWDESGIVDEKEWVLTRHNLKEIQNIMWGYVGIVRSKKQLNRAKRRVHVIYQEIEDYYKKSKISGDLVELRNLAAIAFLIITSALRRNESRGLHHMTDYPDKSDKYLKDTII
ncbi:MAG: L-aspartate oxidase [Cyclobacteriaceae bacterium]|nr:L-aspartate oxidase [Cyclobacteriaceae bacterium]